MGPLPRPYPPTRPIQDGEQRPDAALPRDIGEVRGPDVMRARDLQLAQPSGIDRVGWRPRAGAGRARQGMDPPPRHPRGHRPSSHWLPCTRESPAQHSGSSTRPCDMECVNLAHQGHVLPRDRQCLVVGRRARECQDPAWPNDGQVVGSVDPRVALSHPALVRAPAQPSCSHVRWPHLGRESRAGRFCRLRGGAAAPHRGGCVDHWLCPF